MATQDGWSPDTRRGFGVGLLIAGCVGLVMSLSAGGTAIVLLLSVAMLVGGLRLLVRVP